MRGGPADRDLEEVPVLLTQAPQYPFYLAFETRSCKHRQTLRVGPLRAPLDRYEDTITVTLPARDPGK